MTYKNDRSISQAVVRRLPRYYRYLGELMERGVTRISSSELSTGLGITASQIRQDLNNFGGFGHQGYGYNVDYLHDQIGEILGLTHAYPVIIVGAGNLGNALARYEGFKKRGFHIQALFDIDPKVIGSKTGEHIVRDMKGIEEYLKKKPAQIAMLTLTKSAAKEAADRLVKAGVPSILNFSSIDLAFPEENVIIENVHLSDFLMILSYQLEN